MARAADARPTPAEMKRYPRLLSSLHLAPEARRRRGGPALRAARCRAPRLCAWSAAQPPRGRRGGAALRAARCHAPRLCAWSAAQTPRGRRRGGAVLRAARRRAPRLCAWSERGRWRGPAPTEAPTATPDSALGGGPRVGPRRAPRRCSACGASSSQRRLLRLAWRRPCCAALLFARHAARTRLPAPPLLLHQDDGPQRCRRVRLVTHRLLAGQAFKKEVVVGVARDVAPGVYARVAVVRRGLVVDLARPKHGEIAVLAPQRHRRRAPDVVVVAAVGAVTALGTFVADPPSPRRSRAIWRNAGRLARLSRCGADDVVNLIAVVAAAAAVFVVEKCGERVVRQHVGRLRLCRVGARAAAGQVSVLVA
ncbi:hypothetical protein M885DRAFT_536643 [Pelagophyceae sp. CCMP2097]|nr:hypothetical protein M885DRAFT_536643 [Pelagophyceae sp. CCMP2097]